jgi:hypothetical protein
MRTVAADQRSAFPHRAGVPAWGAVLIALTGTLVGLAIDAASGNGELGAPFAICFALGCIVAVLAVRHSGIFTAVVQPPLLLFVAVPLAYFLFHSSAFGGLKDIAISCGYPLIERFPLMLFTSAAVLLIGMTRWFLAMSPAGQSEDVEDDAASLTARPRMFAGLGAALSAALSRSGTSASEEPSRPRHGTGRQTATRGPRPERRPEESTRSRRPRPSLEDMDAPPRRRQPTRRPTRATQPPLDPPSRRSRAVGDPGRTPPPPRREPRERREDRDQYPPRPARSGRYEPYESERGYPSREPYPPYEPRRRPAPGPSSGTHHPVSRVRYRDSAPADVDDLDSYRKRSGR